jgi:hypothetical protein
LAQDNSLQKAIQHKEITSTRFAGRQFTAEAIHHRENSRQTIDRKTIHRKQNKKEVPQNGILTEYGENFPYSKLEIPMLHYQRSYD